jgi:hypothetical protein
VATTIKAIAVKTEMDDSNVLTAAYTITNGSGGNGGRGATFDNIRSNSGLWNIYMRRTVIMRNG